MSGVWVFDNGVIRLVEKPGPEQAEGSGRRRVLVHAPSNEVITSSAALQTKLTAAGWEPYYEDGAVVQFHRPPSADLISLPKDFTKLKSRHMYDIVVKNRNVFCVKDM